jgi:putative ABC transport system permease protein
MNLIKLSWKNLAHKPLNTLLSLLLFGLGVGLIIFLFLLQTQVQDKFDKNLAGIDLVIGAKGSPLQLILCSMYHIDAPTGNISLEEAGPFMRPGHPLIEKAIPLSLGDNYKGYRIVGTNHELLDLYGAKVEEGSLFEGEMEVTLGANVAKELGLKMGDNFRSAHGLVNDETLEHSDAAPFKVVGILAPTGSVADQLILTPTESIWAVHEEQHHHEEGEEHDHEEEVAPDRQITSLLLQFKARNYQALNLARNINENTNLQAASPALELNRVYSQLGVGMDALQALAYVIVVVSALSIFISLYSSLRERRYELSLMRVMGASRRKLFALIVLEGLLLAMLGFALGFVLSHGSMHLLAGFMKESYRYTFTGFTFLSVEVYVLAGALLTGFLAALIPAIQASRTDISRTLASS